jgi:hypothetical protein
MGKKHEDYEFNIYFYMNHNVKCNNYSILLNMKFLNSFWIKFDFKTYLTYSKASRVVTSAKLIFFQP